MIVDAFFAFVKSIIDLILVPINAVPIDFPDLTGPLASVSAFIGGTYGGVIAWFPFSTFTAAVTVLLVWMVVCHAYRIVLWFLGFLHVAGTDN
jgi:hypothetical protein